MNRKRVFSLTAKRLGFSHGWTIVIALLCMIPCLNEPLGYAQHAKPDVVLHGTVTYADRQTYKELPFAVPKGVTRVSVELSYTERDKHTSIDLGVFDSERFRGWSGGNKSYFTISETDATPSYLPGVIIPGKWKLILGVPNIEEGVRSEYEAKIYFAHAGETPEVSTFSQTPLRNGPAWYRGDLHMHNAHSDGSCLSQSGQKVPCPLYKTVEAAANRKLDFIAITDHNTISQYNDMRELQPYFDQLLLIPGREITTFQGHANVFGTTSFIDFRLTSPHVPNINQMLQQVQDQHGLFSINHPGSPSGAACMGCGWTVPDTDYSRVTSIEAINGGSLDGPRSGIPFWQDKLNKGYRLTGVGGSDNHDADYPPQTRSAIGHPTTVVYAANLSERAILDAIRVGHVFIDIEGTSNRILEFTAQAGTATAAMGDAIQSPADQKVKFSIKMTELEGAHPEVIQDGEITTLVDAAAVQGKEETRNFDYTSDGKRHWLRINIRSSGGSLLIAGNPIYLNF
ncbi:CehA/McbA family metallohydrolase [Acidicapsa acidisoli]|uniref:CehA/McbA family metallohydrolase n=1 Tax=Acidicapsa acidisoli TaxID=1615681 RepID=UPI0021E0A1E0|nr:CehA/McbA family metallohydrolase [Acidicapsa acidisoli]